MRLRRCPWRFLKRPSALAVPVSPRLSVRGKVRFSRTLAELKADR